MFHVSFFLGRLIIGHLERFMLPMVWTIGLSATTRNSYSLWSISLIFRLSIVCIHCLHVPQFNLDNNSLYIFTSSFVKCIYFMFMIKIL